MPKFTEIEIEMVRADLLVKGKELFIENGLRKTSIDEIVKACDIAKGSFYKFFTSKEELYFEIFKKEEENYLQIYETILEKDESNLMIFLMTELWSYLSNNKFLSSFYERKEQDLLLRKISREEIQSYTDEQKKKFIQVIATLQAKNKICLMNPELMVSIIRGILIMSLHRQGIGEHFYEDVMKHMIQFTGKGLETDF
jgi:AcrR family transcriptional regulator